MDGTMAKFLGEAQTLGELMALLQQQRDEGLPDDFPVRTRSLSHTWPVTVEKHELCLILTFD